MKEEDVTDAILVERLQNGNSEAMDALIKRHQVCAYRFACRLTGNHDQAADIVSEAFIRMYRSAQSFRGDSSFTTWMFRIITNSFLDIRKKAIRRPAFSLEAILKSSDRLFERFLETSESNPETVLEARERNQAIEKRVAKLPDHQKIMILLYHQEMLSYEEIAETLNMPIGTVKSRLNRARLKLRETLGREKFLFALDGLKAV